MFKTPYDKSYDKALSAMGELYDEADSLSQELDKVRGALLELTEAMDKAPSLVDDLLGPLKRAKEVLGN